MMFVRKKGRKKEKKEPFHLSFALWVSLDENIGGAERERDEEREKKE